MDAKAQAVSLEPEKQTNHFYLRTRKGDLVGGNYTIPKGDFGRFLGYKAPTRSEEDGTAQVSGRRAIELALQKRFQSLGEATSKSGNVTRNMFISMGRYKDRPGQERQVIKEGLDSVHFALEQSGELNKTYLEMQYKFLWQTKSFSTISNLMKARHDATKRAISEIR